VFAAMNSEMMTESAARTVAATAQSGKTSARNSRQVKRPRVLKPFVKPATPRSKKPARHNENAIGRWCSIGGGNGQTNPVARALWLCPRNTPNDAKRGKIGICSSGWNGDFFALFRVFGGPHCQHDWSV
jgi:hypothetical protein